MSKSVLMTDKENEVTYSLHCYKKWICTALVGLTVLQTAILPVRASDIETMAPTAPVAVEETSAAAAETVPTVATAPVETVAETLPAETGAPETVPMETVPTETAVPVVDEAPEAVAVEAVPVQEEAVPETFDSVPLYFQTDYPDIMYGNGTIESSGCGITCLAMVATYLTGHEYLPDELARYFGGRAENNMERLVVGSEAMQLPFQQMENFHKALEALREGKVVIALMNGDSIFTNSQHFIVLTGFNEEGKIMVHDPYQPNYDHWMLKNAFVNGFSEGDISCGFAGSWAYDKSAMPEEPFLYKEDLPELGEPRYPDIQLTYEEIELLARMVWVEARGESEEGQQAVAEVVLNRLASDNFQSTLKGVIYAENQFRSVDYLDDAEPGQAQFQAIQRAIYGPYVLPEDVVFFATYRVNDNVWGQIGGHIFCYQW